MLGQYFHKRRSLANGLALSGASVGMFAIPPLLQYLLDTYTLKVCMIGLSSTILLYSFKYRYCLGYLYLWSTHFNESMFNKTKNLKVQSKKYLISKSKCWISWFKIQKNSHVFSIKDHARTYNGIHAWTKCIHSNLFNYDFSIEISYVFTHLQVNVWFHSILIFLREQYFHTEWLRIKPRWFRCVLVVELSSP